MANVSLQPGRADLSTDDLIGRVSDGIYIVGDKSWSIDMQRYNFQFTGQRFFRIRDGRLDGQLRDVAYQATTTDFWNSMEAVGGQSTWRLGGAFNCGKAQPGQVAAVSHGCPSALFRGVNVLNTRRRPADERERRGQIGVGPPMIPAQQVVELALAAATVDETIVIVTDRADASLRWAGNSMTTNGVSTTRSVTVISIVRRAIPPTPGRCDPARSTLHRSPHWSRPRSGRPTPHRRPATARPCSPVPGCPTTGTNRSPRPGPKRSPTSPSRSRTASAVPTGCTATPITWSRPRSWPPRPACGSASPSRPARSEINAKRGDASAWAGVSTPWFADVPTDALLDELSMRLGWAERTADLPAGRYETLMPPSTVADMMIYLGWSMDGRGAQEGRSALSAPGGGTRVGRSSPTCR